MSNRAVNAPDHQPTATKRISSLLIIGVGNRYRSDDAVGLIVANELKKINLPHVTIIEHSGEGASLMEAWKPYQTVIIIDAVSSDSPPGTIHRLVAHTQTIPSDFFHYSSHAFSVAEAIELARVTKALPSHVTIFGIEGKNFNAGEKLSAKVSKAAQKVIKIVEDELPSFSQL